MEILLKEADIIVPVGKKYSEESLARNKNPPGSNNTQEKYCCPRTRNVFGESRRIEKKPLEMHYIGLIDCHCGVIVSKKPLIAASFEKSTNLAACYAHLICERESDLARIVKILNPEIKDFATIEKKINLPENFYEMEIRV